MRCHEIGCWWFALNYNSSYSKSSSPYWWQFDNDLNHSSQWHHLRRKGYIASHGWRRYIIWSKRRICVSILTVPHSPITTHPCLYLFSWIISHHSLPGQYKPNITIAFRKFSKWWIIKGNCQIVCHFTEHKSEDPLRMTVWGQLVLWEIDPKSHKLSRHWKRRWITYSENVDMIITENEVWSWSCSWPCWINEILSCLPLLSHNQSLFNVSGILLNSSKNLA